MKTCPYCKAEVPVDAQKCAHCGEWLNAAAARRAKGDLHPAVKVIAVAAMLVLAYLFVMAYFGAL